MEVVKVPELNEDQLDDILSCVHQALREYKMESDTFFVIKVWFPDAAQTYLNTQCPPGNFHIRRCTEANYKTQAIINHAKRIWNKGLIPVEILQMEGALFYGIDKLNPQESNLIFCERI